MANKILGLIILQLALSVTAFAGPGSSGGGDAVKLDFLVAADQALLAVTKQQNEFTPKVDVELFKNTIKADHILSTDDVLYHDGKKVDAYYDKTTDVIKVNRAGWQAIPTSIEKMRLAAHEVFRRMGADDNQYQLSKRLIEIDAARFNLKYSIKRHEGFEPSTTPVMVDTNVSIPITDCYVMGDSGSCRGDWFHQDNVDGHKTFAHVMVRKEWKNNGPVTYILQHFINIDGFSGASEISNWSVVLLGATPVLNTGVLYAQNYKLRSTDEEKSDVNYTQELTLTPWAPF